MIPELFYKEDITPELIELGVLVSDPDSKTEKLSFEWEATAINYDMGYIDFQVNFTDPVWISSGTTEDEIKLNILDIQFFKPKGKLGTARRYLNTAEDFVQPPIN